MINAFCKKPLWECSQTLAAVAQGREPADTVIKGAKLRERVHRRDPGGRRRGRRCGAHRVRRAGRALHRQGHAGHRRAGSVYRARVPRRAHPRGVVHDGCRRVRARRRAARHHGHLLGPARGVQRARPRRSQGHGGGRRAHAAQGDGHHAVVRARRARLRGHGLVRRPRGHRGHHGVAERRGPRRDDELPRHPGRHRPRARRSGRDAQGRQDRDRPLLDARDRPGPQRLRRLRRALLPRVHPRRGRAREDAPRHVRAAALRLGVEGPAGAVPKPCSRTTSTRASPCS